MDNLNNARCKDCVYWEERDDIRPGWGRCHRSPPQQDSGLSLFPATPQDEWCGEFRG